MSSTTMTVLMDDTSPQIIYTGSGWSSNHTGDGAVDQYFDGTFMGTTTSGDFATLKFNGTAIALYGAKRANHGAFSVSLDDGDALTISGLSTTDVFQTVLWSADNLDASKEHSFVLTNLADSWVDLDYVLITAQTDESGTVKTTIMDDSAGGFVYDPSPPSTPSDSSDGWQEVSWVTSETYNSTFHGTPQPGYKVTFPFNGTSIQVFGGKGSNHGNYTVALDGADKQTLSGAFYAAYVSRVVLFSASGLAEGPHEVVLENAEGGGWFDVDYAVVNTTRDWSAAGLAAAASSSSVAAAASASSIATAASSASVAAAASSSAAAAAANDAADATSSTPTGAIAGGVVGGIVALALLAGLLLLVRRRKARPQRLFHDGESIDGDGSVARGKTPVNEMTQVTPFVYSASAQPSSSSLGPLPARPAGAHDRLTSFVTTVAGGAPSPTATEADATSLDPSVIDQHAPWRAAAVHTWSNSSNSDAGSQARLPGALATSLSPLSDSISPADAPGDPRSESSGAASGSGLSKVEQAEADRRAKEKLEASDRRPTRLRVANRESDSGPLRLEEEDVAGADETMLPPDYEQATEHGSPSAHRRQPSAPHHAF